MPDLPHTRLDVERLQARYHQAPNSRLFAALADAQRAAGQSEEAARLLRAGLERHPDYVSALVLLALCHIDLQQEDAAETVFARVLELDPENLVALRYRAERARRRGALERAVDLLRRLLEIDPFDREVQADLGLVATALERKARGEFSQPAEGQAPRDLEPAARAPEAPAARAGPPAPCTEPGPAASIEEPRAAIPAERPPSEASAFELPPIDLSRVGRSVARPAELSPQNRGSLFAPRRPPEPAPQVPDQEARSPIERAVENDRGWKVTRQEDRIVVSPTNAPPRGPIRSVEDRLRSEQHGGTPPPGVPAATPGAQALRPFPAPVPVPPEAPAGGAAAGQAAAAGTPAAPGDEFATLTLARIYESQGYLEKALSIYDELQRQHPGNTEIAERLVALQRRLAGVGETATATPMPLPEPLPLHAPAPAPGDYEDEGVEWRLLDSQSPPSETASRLRRVTEEVRTQERHRYHTIIGTPPDAGSPRLPGRADEIEPAPAEDLSRGHADFQRFLDYVRALKR